jgi:hypothetical protein
MDDVEAYNCLMWFDSMERKLVKFCRIVPPQNQNENTWSPLLAEIIVEASSIVDSLFCHIAGSVTTASNTGTTKNNLDLSDYYDLYNDANRLSQRKLILLTTPPEFLSPFDCWTRAQAPAWWTTHNKLKHDRLKNMPDAHLSSAIKAAGGALMLFCAFAEEHASLLQALMRHESLSSYNQNPEILLKHAKDKTLRRYLHSRPIWSLSKLFAVMLGEDELPHRIEDFRPAPLNGGSKLTEFFGRI